MRLSITPVGVMANTSAPWIRPIEATYSCATPPRRYEPRALAAGVVTERLGNPARRSMETPLTKLDITTRKNPRHPDR